MTDQTETRELRERLTAALADRATVDIALADAQLRTRELETALQQVTYHRNRLLTEKHVAWGIVLSPETAPLPTEPDYQRLAAAVLEIARTLNYPTPSVVHLVRAAFLATAPSRAIVAWAVREISTGMLFEIDYTRVSVDGPCYARNAKRLVGPGFDVVGLAIALESATRDEHPASGAAEKT